MKKKRLDAILFEMGWVTEAQFRQALMRQKSRGGKLGSNLLFFRFLTEEQLAEALAKQFDVPAFSLEQLEEPSGEALSRIPVEIADEHLLFPLRLEQEGRLLQLVVSDPEDSKALTSVKQVARVNSLQLSVAPEMTIRNLISRHYRGRERDPAAHRIIDLPDLFAEEKAPEAPDHTTEVASAPAPHRKALFLTDQVFLRNVLPSIFERDGWDLIVAADVDQAFEALHHSQAIEKILVCENLAGVLKDRMQTMTDRLSASPPGVVRFGSIPDALFENSAPYKHMMESLLRAVQTIADLRLPENGWKPPYAPIERDVQRLGRALSLRPLVVDGLRLLVHLLAASFLPEDEKPEQGARRLRSSSFADLLESRRLAAHLDFPWNLVVCLDTLEQLLDGVQAPRDLGFGGSEANAAAQVLAVAWFRAIVRHAPAHGPEQVESSLREQVGLLATPVVIEAYLKLLDEEVTPPSDRSHRDVFVMEGMEKTAFPAVSELRRHGYRPVEIREWAEVYRLFNRRKPSAILINFDSAPADANELARRLKKEGRSASVALFGFSARTDDALVMDMLEAGFTDVFTPPFMGAVIMARITRLLTVFAERSIAMEPGGFSASFNEMSFLDLVQALSTGGKNVRIEIESDTAGRATVYIRSGQIVHAVCESLEGLEAVYRVIGWRDQGRFRMEPCTAFPVDNISVPNDYILMEGCRLLDEAQETAHDMESSTEISGAPRQA